MVHTAEGAAQRFTKRDVRVNGAALDPSGLRVLRLVVGDESDSGRADPDAHPSPVSSPAFLEWAARLGTAAAMPNVYLPGAPRLSSPHGAAVFTGAPVDPLTRRYLTAAIDARALRARARVLQWLAVRSAIDLTREVRWTSLACGPALPVVAALAEAHEAGIDAHATFIDTCSDSLDVTRRLVRGHGLDPAEHAFLTRDEAIVAEEPPVPEGSQDVVEALDLLVGRCPEEAARALGAAFALVRPGGALVFSAMLADRPDPDARAAWPSGRLWTLAEAAALIDAAGVEVADALAYLTADGVYAVIEIERL
ncbi:hypothetical protein [Demequina iriomotensis]|uniref:hypothetical protein n=1 Tax=Demequina iriomotensis TaxID=1536641 RepID=UPI000B1368F3|nr:hypothetical protein [Demequina iriomotensis]